MMSEPNKALRRRGNPRASEKAGESGDVGANTTLHCKRKNLTRFSPTRAPGQTEIDIAEWEE